MKILLLNGPNLNLLGEREPGIYGAMTLPELEAALQSQAENLGAELICQQSNHEGQLIDWLHQARSWAQGVIFNPGAYTHSSIALADAISATGLTVIEVHLSNIYKRETFRHHSMIAPVAWGQISGLGTEGYFLALNALLKRVGSGSA
ncbi:MAG: type II 3-dehydroquinate dehydratase [Candidatus Sericytochromatia bacterium]